MIQSQLDLTKATQLARGAQNAAVIAGLNSSETFERMLHAIQANSVEILRTIGLNVSFENSYKKLARELDKNVDQLTEAEKVQSRFNAVLDGTTQVAGAYEAAMTTAGKQMLSFARYTQNFRIALGEAFEPALAEIVEKAGKAVKEFTVQIKDPAFQKSMAEFAKVFATQIVNAFQWLIDNKETILNVVKDIATAAGNVIKSLTALYDLLFPSQERIAQRQKQEFQRITADLAKFIAERDKILEDMERREELKKTRAAEPPIPLWEDPKKWAKGIVDDVEATFDTFDFGKAERRLKVLDTYIKEFTETANKLKKEIDSVGKPEKEVNYAEIFGKSALDATIKHFRGIKKEVQKEPLGSTLLESAFKRTAANVKLELAKLNSDYDKHLIKLDEYFRKREELAKKSFENESKYLRSQAEKEQDPDKRQKILDRIYVLEKNYQEQLINLSKQRFSEEKQLAEKQLNIEKVLQSARISITQKGTNLESIEKAELQQLETTQQERLKNLQDEFATRDQLKENEIISNQERIKLEEGQEKRRAENILEINKVLQDARANLVDPNNLKAQFDLELQWLKENQDERLKQIEEAKINEEEKKKAIDEHYKLLELERQKLHNEQRLALEEHLIDGLSTAFASLNETMGDLYSTTGQREFFNIQKAIAIAQATIATYEAATEAYKWGMAFGGPTAPAIAAAAAAVAVAQGLAKVAIIKAQSYAKGGVVKGESPHPKADNVPANLTAGEYVQPVDVVKYYGVKGMELIRKKLIPPEVLYQGKILYEKSIDFKQSIQKKISDVKDYSKKVSELSDIVKTIVGKSKETKALERLISITSNFSSEKSTSVSVEKSTAEKTTDRVIDRLIEKLTFDRSSDKAIKSKSKVKKKYIKEISHVATDIERSTRDRISAINKYRNSEYTTYYSKDRTSATDIRRDRESIKDSKRFDSVRESFKDSESRELQQSRIWVKDSVFQSSFIGDLVKNTIEKQKVENNIKEVLSKTLIDKLVDKSVSSKLVAEKIDVNKEVIDRAVERISAYGKKKVYEKLFDYSSVKEVIEKSFGKKKYDSSFVDRIVEKSVIDRIAERSAMTTEKNNARYESAISNSINRINEVILKGWEPLKYRDKWETSKGDRTFTVSAHSGVREFEQKIKDTFVDRILFKDRSFIQFIKDISEDKSFIQNAIKDKLFIADKIKNKSFIKNVSSSERLSIIQTIQDVVKDKSLIQNIISSEVKDRTISKDVLTHGLLKSFVSIVDISESREALNKVIANNIVDRKREKLTTEKQLNLVKTITKPIERIVSAISERTTSLVPVVVRDSIDNSRRYSYSIVNSSGDQLYKSVKLKTKEAIQSFASGGQILGYSPSPSADNITIKATAGEYIQPVNVVKYYGSKAMEAIRQKIVPREVIASYANRLSIPPPNYTHEFAMGGTVGGTLIKEKPSVVINVKNNTGQPVDVKEERVEFDGEKVIADVVLQKFVTSRSYRQTFKTGR